MCFLFVYVSIMLIYCIAKHLSHEECDSEYENAFLVSVFHV